jgi:hypothetical protein
MALKKEEGAGWEKAKQTNERRVGRGESVRKVGCVVPVNRFSARILNKMSTVPSVGKKVLN